MARVLLFIVLAVCLSLHASRAFVPNLAFKSLLAAIGSTTHKDMTQSAILQVTAALLRDNPNPDPAVDSTRKINALSTLSPARLIRAYYEARQQRERVRAYKDAIDDIGDANSKVDTGSEGKVAAAHFDEEQFQLGQNRLNEIILMMIKDIQSCRFQSARILAGRMLHTLQDFYSHSNWVEMGRNNPYSVLGKKGQKPGKVAPETMHTCSDCERNILYVAGSYISPLLNYVAQPKYICNDNIRAEVNQRGFLTSGYYTRLDDDVRNLFRNEKPNGKCSHGGFLDATSDHSATGGINKDSTRSSWSPHYNYHQQAAAIATQASTDILQDIRSQVNDDTKFAAFLGLELEVIMLSISYVIDTTGSMREELPQIQRAIPQIRNDLDQYVQSLGENVQVRFILVPFNDPDPGAVFQTENIDDFLNAIGQLRASGGGDCPEPSIGALVRAIRASEPNSPIYVYTDAPPSDPNRLAEAQALISEKSVTVNYGLTDGCRGKRKRSLQQNNQDYSHVEKRQTSSGSESVYQFLAALSGGQVLNLQPTDIGDLSSLISFSAARTYTTIFYQSGPLAGTYRFRFPVDETVTAVLISINGRFIQVTVRNPQGTASTVLDPSLYSVSLQSSTSYIATINVSDSVHYGEWQLNLTVYSGPYTVRIAAITDLTFEYTLYRFDLSSSYGFTTVEGNPQQGERLLLFVQTQNEIEGTSFNRASLLDNSGDVVETLNLTSAGDGGYLASDLFIPPETFQLQIHGFDSNGNPISRISSSGVQTVDVDLRLGKGQSEFNTLFPGDEGNVTLELYNLGASRNFTIEVTADRDASSLNDSLNQFNFSVNPERVFVAENETTMIVITVIAPENATDGTGVTLTATASSDEGESDFVAFEVTVSTIPPPEDTENDYYDAGIQVRVGVWCILAVVACMMILSPF